MTNAELIEALREAKKHFWTQPQIELYPMMEAAADALEAAEKRIAELEEEHNKTVTAIFWEEQLWWENRCKELEARLPKEGEFLKRGGNDVDCNSDT